MAGASTNGSFTMSLRADHYDAAPAAAQGRQHLRLLPVRYAEPLRLAQARPPLANLPENDAHALVRQALLERKTLVIGLADGLSSVSFSGNGVELLVEHDFGARHRGLHSLCTAGWIIWEIYRGCPSRVLGDLLTFLPVAETLATA